MDKPKAYSYIRFSSPEQAKGDSYRRQRKIAEDYCRAQGLEFLDNSEYLFFDRGRSAHTGAHRDDTSELKRFLDYVDEGRIESGSTLIVESLDRLSREKVSVALQQFLDLLKKGINVYTSADARLFTKDVQSLDLFVSVFAMARAHGESALKALRVSQAWQQKQALARSEKRPLGKACPYWLEFRDRAYHLIPERVEVVRQIFSLSQQGHGQRLIAKMLNASGVAPFGGAGRNAKNAWGSSSVGKLLANKAVLGWYQPTRLIERVRTNVGEPVEDFFPRILSDDDFYAAQSARASRAQFKTTKPAANFNVWVGICKCRLCGEPMHRVDKGKPPKGRKYLRCYGNAKGVCTNKMVGLTESEDVFREILAKVDSLSLVQDSSKAMEKRLAVSVGKSGEIQSRLKELSDQASALSGKLPTTIIGVMATLEQELAREQEAQESLKADIARESIISKDDFFERLDMVTFEGRAAANTLMKRLGLNTYVRASSPSTAIFDVSPEMPDEFKGKWPTMRFHMQPESITFEPFTDASLIAGLNQGDSDMSDYDAP